jgi:hypothetical protein
MKTKDLSLVLSLPAITTLREALLHMHLTSSGSSSSTNNTADTAMLAQQRALRTTYTKELLRQLHRHEVGRLSLASTTTMHMHHHMNVINPVNALIPVQTQLRTRKQGYRDLRYWEKEDRLLREAKKKAKKAKQSEFFKALTMHQESFFKFHKEARNGKSIKR